jgi:hypothetical protein
LCNNELVMKYSTGVLLFLALSTGIGAKARTDLRIPTETFQSNAVVTTGETYYSRTKFSGAKIINGSVLTTDNVGTAATGVTATEWGDGHYNHVKLAFSALTIGTVDTGTGNNGALSKVLYTLPTTNGAHYVVDLATINLALSSTNGNLHANTPNLGLGTSAASGSISLISQTTNANDLFAGSTMTDVNGSTVFTTKVPTTKIIDLNAERNIRLNLAEKFGAADNGGVIKATGSVVFSYKVHE